MDLRQNLAPVIADLEAEGARIAAAVDALKELCAQSGGIRKSSTIPQKRQPAKKKPTQTPPSGGTAHNEGSTRQLILDHIVGHPGSTRTAIAEALGVSESCVGYHLTRLKKAKLVVMMGAPSTGVTWSSTSPRQHTPHGARSTPELKYRCDACRAKFLTAAQLSQHNEIYHGGTTATRPIWTCSECGKTFHDELDYEAHMEAIHDIDI
mgnify:CR=1 FL=1